MIRTNCCITEAAVCEPLAQPALLLPSGFANAVYCDEIMVEAQRRNLQLVVKPLAKRSGKGHQLSYELTTECGLQRIISESRLLMNWATSPYATWVRRQS